MQHLNTFVDFTKLHTDSESSNLLLHQPLSSLFLFSSCPPILLPPYVPEILGDLKTAYHILPAESKHSCTPILREKQCMQEKYPTHINQLLPQNSLDKPLIWTIKSCLGHQTATHHLPWFTTEDQDCTMQDCLASITKSRTQGSEPTYVFIAIARIVLTPENSEAQRRAGLQDHNTANYRNAHC